MKKLIALALVILVASSCDPIAEYDAYIENATPTNLSIAFFSSDIELNRSLNITSGQTVFFQEGSDIGSTFIQPSLVQYDSIVVRNEENQIIRVYKENDPGKNIYNVDAYWAGRETSKWVYEYEYQIESIDLD
ncbi:MAG: hypothetical protein ED555_01000 [Allomuricauda sp.]|nr:MAG: hypothetical protein ED555_01000 [Allomuricauda sp.]